MPIITRAQVVANCSTLWAAGSRPYSQSTIDPITGYRRDCSGFACMVLGIPLDTPGSWGGLNTATMVTSGLCYEIPAADLQPGDLVGIMGAGSEGDAGHVTVFEGWLNQDPENNDYYMWEQAGGTSGPRRRLVTYPFGSWRAYRYRDIVDELPAPPPAPVPVPVPVPVPMPAPVPVPPPPAGGLVLTIDGAQLVQAVVAAVTAQLEAQLAGLAAQLAANGAADVTRDAALRKAIADAATAQAAALTSALG